MSDYRVTVGGKKSYNIGVNYEIPSKSIQYTNEIIEDFSELFDGILTTFNIVVRGQSYTPLNEQQLLISINDELLKPNVDYLVSGNQIFFTDPPAPGAKFSGVAMATTADLTRTINFVIDAGSTDMVPGVKGQLTLDVTGTIDEWTVVGDRPGYALVDIKKSSFQNYPTLTSITGNEKPYIGSPNDPTEQKRKDQDLSTWDRVLNAGDILQYEIIAASNVKVLLIALKVHL